MMETVLVDRRNIQTELPKMVAAVAAANFIGLDCETHDDNRHEGLNNLMKVDEETRKKAGNTRLMFDMRRTVVTGFSIYPEGSQTAWYINLGHADVHNRVTFEEVRAVLDARKPGAQWIAHNAPYELTVFRNSLGYLLTDIICTMQLSVTAFGDDNYDIAEFQVAPLGGMFKWGRDLLEAAMRGGPSNEMAQDLAVLGLSQAPEDLHAHYLTLPASPAREAAYQRLCADVYDDADERSSKFSREVEDIIGKITSKTSTASHSYNGYIKDLAYGHGLKSLVYTFFGATMGTFKETLGVSAHMGQLTGDQVRQYGAEDAYWVVPLFHHLLGMVAKDSPDAIETFFSQENPMTHVYSDVWVGGMRVNYPAIEARREVERATYASLLRSLRAALRACPDFDPSPSAELLKRQPWYATGWSKYREKICRFRDADDLEDDFQECQRVKGAVSSAWASERKLDTIDFSIMHYMPIRTILYDLLGAKLMFDMGKIASDGDARGRVKIWLERYDPNPAKLQVLDCITAMTGVETRMKLYLTPYVSLTDPETGYLYPTLNSLLNTRRLAASTPNVLALAKRGESTYVRGFFLGDHYA